MIRKTLCGLATLAGALILTMGLAAPAQAQSGSVMNAAQEDPAFAHGEPGFTATAGQECGTVDITFTNPTPWLFVFDVRVDGEPSINPSVAEGVEIAEGPLAGDEFGPRWTLVEVDGSAGTGEVTKTFTFTGSVEVRLAEGAAQKLYFDFETVDTSGVEPCPDPTPGPTTEPTAGPTPSEEPSASPRPTETEQPGKGLPVTSGPTLLPALGIGGGALLGLGGTLAWLGRRKRAAVTE